MLLAVPAAITGAPEESRAARGASDLDRRLAMHAAEVRRGRSVVRFFANHRWLLQSPRFAPVARNRLTTAQGRLARAERRLAATRRAIEARSRHRRPAAKRKPHATRQLASTLPPTAQEVICEVFGPHCSEALAVARCESRYRTDARNGQYLGLFQMGDWARSNYGHGASAREQAKAAHRLFVDTGNSWQQWSCQP